MARTAQPLDPKRRSRLLHQARLAFAANGFSATRLTSLLEQATFPRSSFYYFFGTKERLLDEAVADGLHELGALVHIPRVADLDADSFWPSLTELTADLSAAAERPDLVAVGAIYHLDDLPPCRSLDTFKEALIDWNMSLVSRGLELGLLDPLIPAQMHAELAYAVVNCIDRWATQDAAHRDRAQEIVCTILPRMLGAPRTHTSHTQRTQPVSGKKQDDS